MCGYLESTNIEILIYFLFYCTYRQHFCPADKTDSPKIRQSCCWAPRSSIQLSRSPSRPPRWHQSLPRWSSWRGRLGGGWQGRGGSSPGCSGGPSGSSWTSVLCRCTLLAAPPCTFPSPCRPRSPGRRQPCRWQRPQGGCSHSPDATGRVLCCQGGQGWSQGCSWRRWQPWWTGDGEVAARAYMSWGEPVRSPPNSRRSNCAEDLSTETDVKS